MTAPSGLVTPGAAAGVAAGTAPCPGQRTVLSSTRGCRCAELLVGIRPAT